MAALGLGGGPPPGVAYGAAGGGNAAGLWELEDAARRLLRAPVSEAGWLQAFPTFPETRSLLALSEELAVAVVSRSFVHGSEESLLAWCVFLLASAADAGALAEPRRTGVINRGWWAVKLARTFVTRLAYSDSPVPTPAGQPARDVAATQRLVASKLAPLLEALGRSLETAGEAAGQHPLLVIRAVTAALSLHSHACGHAGSQPVAALDAAPLIRRLWALVPESSATPLQGGSPESTLAPSAARLIQQLLLCHPEGAVALLEPLCALEKLRGWVGDGSTPPTLKAELVNLLCTLFKHAPPDSLRALQEARLGECVAVAAGDGRAALVTRVAALVAVGALRERPEFHGAHWWDAVEPPLRGCCACLLDALAEPQARRALLSHFHSSPGGRPARARALVTACAAGDPPSLLLAAARLCLATAPERLAAAGRPERRELLAVPALAPAMLSLATDLGEDPHSLLLRRLGETLLTHLAACQALEGEPALMAAMCAATRSVAQLAPTVTLRLLPEQPEDDGTPGWPVSLPANRQLLAASCPPFGAMFHGCGGVHAEAQAGVVTLRGVDPGGAQALLTWLSTGALRHPGGLEEVLAVYSVAERLMVPSLLHVCAALAKSVVTADNVGALLRFADAAGREELCDWACAWAVRGGHATALVRSGCLADLPGGAAHALMLAIAQRADSAAASDAQEGARKRGREEEEAEMERNAGAQRLQT